MSEPDLKFIDIRKEESDNEEEDKVDEEEFEED